jgi:hypothetical protein
VWAYTLGDSACKTYAAGLYPLWDASGFDYYTIDPALDDILVYIPIPVCTHREALVMLANYTGAYLIHRSDGTLAVTTTLGGINDYHIDILRVYERPTTIKGSAIGTLRGTLKRYTQEGWTSEILSTQVIRAGSGSLQYILTHEACAATDLSITSGGATIDGSPVFNTYSTIFYATATSDFNVVLTGYRADVVAARFDLTLDQSGGEIREIDNPLTSDPDLTTAMYRAYAAIEGSYRYRFTMRDDAAIEVGDRLYLDTLAVPDGFAVIVAEIRRGFNGGTEAEYLVYADPTTEWIQDDFVQSDLIV